MEAMQGESAFFLFSRKMPGVGYSLGCIPQSLTSSTSLNSFISLCFRTLVTNRALQNPRNPFLFYRFRTVAQNNRGGTISQALSYHRLPVTALWFTPSY